MNKNIFTIRNEHGSIIATGTCLRDLAQRVSHTPDKWVRVEQINYSGSLTWTVLKSSLASMMSLVASESHTSN